MANKENLSPSKNMANERLRTYRELLREMRDIQETDDVGINTAKRIKDILKTANELVEGVPIAERIKNEQEAIFDSKLFSCSSGILVKCAQNLVIAKIQYEPAEFCLKLSHHTCDLNGVNNFEKLLGKARAIIPELPLLRTMLDTFGAETLNQTKVARVRNKQSQETVVKKKLEKVVTLQQDEQGVEETVSFLKAVLQNEFENNDQRPLSYYNYVVDKQNFEATIENMFHAAFLARDGKAEVTIDRNNDITIKPTHKKQLQTFRKESGKNSQSIVYFTMEDWEELDTEEGIIEKHTRHMQK